MSRLGAPLHTRPWRVLLPLLALATLTLAALVWPRPATAGPPVQIEFWHAMSRKRGEVLDRLVARFNAQNPDIVVKARFVGAANPRLGNDYNALYRAILENLARGNPPDISQVYENWTTQLIEIRAIVPMESFFSGPHGMTEAQIADFVPVFREANEFEGKKIWTLPFNKSIYVLYYNRRIFRELGLRPPQNWSEFRGAAQVIAQKKGIPGLVFLPGVDIFGHYLYAYGGNFVQTNRASFGGALGVRDMQYWVELVHTDRSALPTFDAEDLFAQGKAGMYIETTSKLGRLQNAEGLDLGVALLPRGDTRAYQFAGTNLAIFAHSSRERQLAAWRLARFLTSPEVTTEWAMATGYLPVRLSAIRSQTYQDYIRRNPNYAVGIRALDHAVVQPRVAAWESIRGIVDDAMFEVISRKSTPQDALARAESLANDLLSSLQGQK
jgi:multiple sugar transport system substrate-binding protein